MVDSHYQAESTPATNPIPAPRGGPSQHGAALGQALADLAEAGTSDAEPCICCAYRRGSMPNQAASTVSAALSCLTSDDQFYCHHALDPDGNPTRRCAGFERATMAIEHDFSAFKRAMGKALAGVDAVAGRPDAVRADYEQWLLTADPDNRLDDYQRAALFARRLATQDTGQ